MLQVVLRNKRASCRMGGVKNKEKLVLTRGRNGVECLALVRGFHVGSGAAE